MVKALFDTNILIDYLNGRREAQQELRLYADRAISVVTWMEVMAGATPAKTTATEQFLATFKVIAVDDGIARRAVGLRRSTRVKLPDAIIWATAQAGGMILVTRNTKDFPPDDPGVRVPYKT